MWKAVRNEVTSDAKMARSNSSPSSLGLLSSILSCMARAMSLHMACFSLSALSLYGSSLERMSWMWAQMMTKVALAYLSGSST